MCSDDFFPGYVFRGKKEGAEDIERIDGEEGSEEQEHKDDECDRDGEEVEKDDCQGTDVHRFKLRMNLGVAVD